MGQDTTGTALLTTAAAAARHPIKQLWIDWEDYGFVADAQLHHWTDESARVKEMSGDMQGVNYLKSLAAVGSGVVNVATVLLDNTDFRYSPSNESSPLRYDSGSTGTNLIANNSFEDAGALPPVFDVWHEDVGDGAVTDELVLFYTLAHACKLTCGASNNTGVHQHVTGIIPGIKYSCRLYTRVAAGDSAGRYSVYDVTNGADIIAGTAGGADGSVVYTLVPFQFVAPVGCTEIALYLYPSAANGDIAYFDSVRVANVDYLGNGGIHFKRAIIRTGFYSSTNLILNPGFETHAADDFDDWVETASDGAIVVTATVHGGTHACLLTEGATTGIAGCHIEQDFIVVPGNVYLLTFWTRGLADHAGLYGVYDATGGADIIAATNTGVGGDTYTQVSTTFTAPTGCVLARLIFYPGATAGWRAYFDDVSLTAYEYLRQMTGYIVSATEAYAARTITLELRDRGADLALARMSTGPEGTYTRLHENVTAHTYLDALVTQWNGATPAMGRDDIGTCVFDAGMVNLAYAWMDDETVWSEMQAVAESQMGRLWYDKDGDLHFDDGTHWATPGGNAWDDPTVVQAALVMAFKDCNPIYEFTNVANHIKVNHQAYYANPVADVEYELKEVLMVPPGGGTLIHKAEMQTPVQTYGANCFGAAPTYAVPHTHVQATSAYWAVTAGGTEINNDITITSKVYTGRVEFTITNANATYTAFITKLELNADHPLDDQASAGIYECEDAASIALHGRLTMPVNNRYIQDRLHASIVGDFLLSRFKEPVEVLTLSGVPARPWLEVGDRTHLQDTAGSGIHADYLLGRITWRFGDGGYTQTLSAMLVSDLFPVADWFIIGTSKYGSGADHGHYFW